MAAQNYTLTVDNGQVTGAQLPVGTYTYVSNTIPGYTTGTLESFTITPSTTALDIFITADGTLTVNVKDDLGADITAGSLVFSSADGASEYGAAVNITNGTATFSNVPYDTAGIALNIKQPASDESHDPIATPQAYSMTESPATTNIINQRKVITLDLTLADENYAGVTALNGNLVVNG